MNQLQLSAKKKLHRKNRVRLATRGTQERPRLHVFRSSQHVYAQIINDEANKTLASACDQEVGKKGTKTQKAALVGELIAQKAKKSKISKVRFDRGQNKFHGRIKALAEAARSNGLEF